MRILLFLLPFLSLAQVITVGGNPAGVSVSDGPVRFGSVVTLGSPESGATYQIELTELDAFPAAFGAGKDFRINPSTATIYEVTNLNDSGAGSFRAAFSATGARIIIIKVEGIMTQSSALSNTSTSGGNVAIWGQFAPGLGLTLNGGRWSWSNSGNILVRFMTSQNNDTDCTVNVDCFDALNFYKQAANSSIYVDHCSLRYGPDQTYTIESENGTGKSTSAYVLMAEGDPAHNTGSIIGDQGNDDFNVGSHTFARNMFYNISHRTPNMSGLTGGFEIYNQWISNWSGRLSRTNGNIDVDWFKNYCIEGNKSHFSPNYVNQMSDAFDDFKTYTADNYVSGFDESPSGLQTNLWVNFTTNSEGADEAPILSYHYVSSRINSFGDPADGIWDVLDVPAKLTNTVGHNRGINSDGTPFLGHDDKDESYISKTLAGTTETDYRLPAAWDNSTFPGTSMYADTDDDHMPDWFEDQFAFLDKNDSGDMLETNTTWDFSPLGADYDYEVTNTAGYTNLEMCAAFYAGDFETIIDGANDLNLE